MTQTNNKFENINVIEYIKKYLINNGFIIKSSVITEYNYFEFIKRITKDGNILIFIDNDYINIKINYITLIEPYYLFYYDKISIEYITDHINDLDMIISKSLMKGIVNIYNKILFNDFKVKIDI